MQIVVFYGFKNIPVFRQAPLSIPMGVPEVSKTVQNHHNLGGRFEGGGGELLSLWILSRQGPTSYYSHLYYTV